MLMFQWSCPLSKNFHHHAILYWSHRSYAFGTLVFIPHFQDSLESLDNLDNLPKRLKSIDEKVDSSSHSLASLSDKVSLKLRDIEGYVDGSKVA